MALITEQCSRIVLALTPNMFASMVAEHIRLKMYSRDTPSVECMPTLDVREIPPVDRHTKIHNEFEEMDPGETLTIVNDHEPKPLYYEMEAEVSAFDADGYEVRQEATDKFVAEFPKVEG